MAGVFVTSFQLRIYFMINFKHKTIKFQWKSCKIIIFHESNLICFDLFIYIIDVNANRYLHDITGMYCQQYLMFSFATEWEIFHSKMNGKTRLHVGERKKNKFLLIGNEFVIYNSVQQIHIWCRVLDRKTVGH